MNIKQQQLDSMEEALQDLLERQEELERRAYRVSSPHIRKDEREDREEVLADIQKYEDELMEDIQDIRIGWGGTLLKKRILVQTLDMIRNELLEIKRNLIK